MPLGQGPSWHPRALWDHCSLTLSHASKLPTPAQHPFPALADPAPRRGVRRDGCPPCPRGYFGQHLASAATCQGRAVRLEPNCPHQAPQCPQAQPGTVGMSSRDCGILQSMAVHAAGGVGARVPVVVGAERAGQQPRPELINAAQYSRYTLTPLFVPYPPAEASCQPQGSKSTATERLRSCAGHFTSPLDPREHHRAEPGLSVTGHQRPQHQQCGGSGHQPQEPQQHSQATQHLGQKKHLSACLLGKGRQGAAQPRECLFCCPAVSPAGSWCSPVCCPCPRPQSLAPLQKPELSIAWASAALELQWPQGWGGCFRHAGAAGSPWPDAPGMQPGHSSHHAARSCQPGQNLGMDHGSKGSSGFV